MTNINRHFINTAGDDLQFIEEKSAILSQNADCPNCHCELTTPYIVCVVCNVNICRPCFANGSEFLNHKNDHDYSIFDDKLPLFEDTNWTAKEELIMLDTLLEYGNFNIVCRYLPNRTVKDVKDHYDQFYLEKRGSNLLPSFPEIQVSQSSCQVIPYKFCLSDMNEPPRYTPNSIGFHSMAGYNAARSDFVSDYDSNAEDLISNLNFMPPSCQDPDYNAITNLQCAIINAYNRRLSERERRKSVIRDHGLISIQKTVSWLHRYDTTITKRIYERLCIFMQFCTGMQFEFFMEGLHRSGELKAEISRLCQFRKKGITSIKGAQLYMQMKQKREESMKNVKMFQNKIPLNRKVTESLASVVQPTKAIKRNFTPLEVVGLPDYEKLTSKEQELCRNVRLVPVSYIQFRNILINENKTKGYLKLQTARRLLKIDVNKTRRLYNFLVEEGHVNEQ